MNAEKIFGKNVYVNLDEVIETVYQCRRAEANDEWLKRWLKPLKSLPTIEVSEDCINRITVLEIYSDLYWIDERLLNFKDELDKVYEKLRTAPSVVPKE